MDYSRSNQELFDEIKGGLARRRDYEPGNVGRLTVLFRFDVGQQEVWGQEFFVYSNQAEGFVYRGLFSNEIRLTVDDLLNDGDGWDRLEFWILGEKDHEVRYWANDAASQYWQPNQEVHIRFGTSRELDHNDLIQMFDVNFVRIE
ncbi:MAG: hypothetical protein IPK82_30950 [Polyangiaceae bacterium]|nr:hypothetical protein [Polyangiaceae bacterium]